MYTKFSKNLINLLKNYAFKKCNNNNNNNNNNSLINYLVLRDANLEVYLRIV